MVIIKVEGIIEVIGIGYNKCKKTYKTKDDKEAVIFFHGYLNWLHFKVVF
jgi:hypothetical protein